MNLGNRTFIITFLIVTITAVIASIPTDLDLGITYFKSHKFDQSFKYLSKVKQLDQDNLFAVKHLKNYFIANGELKKAIAMQIQVQKLRPKNIEYIRELVKLYVWTGKTLLSLKALELSIPLIEKSKQEHFVSKIADGYRHLKEFHDASRLYQSISNTSELQILKMGIHYFLSTGNLKESIQWLERHLSIEKDKMYFVKLADCYELDKNIPLAQINLVKHLGPDFSKSLDLINLPKNIFFENLDIIAKVLKFEKELFGISNVINFYEKAFIKYPSNELIAFQYSDILIRNGFADKASNVYRRYKSAIDKQLLDYHQLAIRWKDLKKYREAIKTYKEIIKMKGVKADHYQELADIYEQTNQSDLALKYYYKYLNFIENNNEPNIKINKTVKVGRTPSSKNKLVKADEVRFKIGRIYYERGDFKKAYVILHALYTKGIQNIYVLELLLDIALQNKEYNEAREYRHQLLLKKSDHHQANLFLLEDLSKTNIEQFNKEYLRIQKLQAFQHNRDIVRIQLNALNRFKKWDYKREVCKLSLKQNHKNSALDYSILIDCLEKDKDRQLVSSLYDEAVSKYPKNDNMLDSAIYFALDSKQLKTSAHLLKLKQGRGFVNKNTSEQMIYQKYLADQHKFQNRFEASSGVKYNDYENHNITEYEIELTKRKDKFEFGLKNQRYTFNNKEKDSPTWSSVTPRISYHEDFLTTTFGYKIPIGKRKLQTPIFGKATLRDNQGTYLEISMLNSDFEMGSTSQSASANSEHQLISLYSEIRRFDKQLIILSTENKIVNGISNKTKGQQYGARYYFRPFSNLKLWAGPYMNYQEYRTGNIVNRDDSFYGLTSIFEKKKKSWEIYSQVDIGRDIETSIRTRSRALFKYTYKLNNSSKITCFMDIAKENKDTFSSGMTFNFSM